MNCQFYQIFVRLQYISINTDTHTQGDNMFKKILSSFWDFLCAMGEARYAAELARSGRWQEAQQIYRK